ncbi:MAG: bifunctional diaminohydroxyphosphoribosylaminopyrimidine deaminase/5-amino-6-(5-phosphoribosylamino)uracil reductase RibD [Cyclobacteriaceae bacterium]
MISDKFYMLRAMELAKNGIGHVSPNPLVGCVIVYEGKIIGEGWHGKYGEAHAEVNAVNAVADKSILNGAAVYVNLEPCAHTGKTPPCADLLVKHKVKRVVIANVDPNPLVAGKGIAKLKDAGVEVLTGVLEEAGRELNKRFFTFLKHKRPFVILKWAQTSDGFIARENFDSKWISNEYSRKLVHKWRTEEDSILVGYNTALYDNPKLTARDWTGRNPVRIVIDPKLNLDPRLHLLDGTSLTICYNTLRQDNKGNVVYHLLDQKHLFQDMLSDLFNRNIQSLLVEGGAQTIKNLLTDNVWDEARVFTSGQRFESGIKAPIINQEAIGSEMIGDDELSTYFNNN